MYNKGVTGITKRKVRKHIYDIVHIVLYIRQTGVVLPHDIYHDCCIFIEMIKKETIDMEQISGIQEYTIERFVEDFTNIFTESDYK